MQFAHRLFSALGLAVLSAASLAGPVYTSSSAFLAHVASGSYTETFNGLTTYPVGGFSSGGFGYTISAIDGLYFSGQNPGGPSGDFVGTNLPDEALKIDFTSGNVTALGANFFATNISDVFQAVSLMLTLSDGTIETFTPSSLSDSYRGFTSGVAFTSLVISGPGASLYAGLDNLTVGRAVPEPASLALVGIALVGLRLTRRRSV